MRLFSCQTVNASMIEILMREFWGGLSARHVSMALAFGLYAVFSSPTPDIYRFTELAIFILLIFSVKLHIGNMPGSGIILLIYGLSVPFITSLVKGYDFFLILRDFIPFLFLLMPLFFQYQNKQDRNFLVWLAAGIGFAFALRSLLAFGPRLWSPSLWSGAPPDLLYLANSPEVLFSSVWLGALAFTSHRNIVLRLLFFILAVVSAWAMAAAMQRASLAYIALCGAISFFVSCYQKPVKAFALFLMILCGGFILWPVISDIFLQLSIKTHLVGLNSRSEEVKAVINQLAASPWNFIFGLGWGAEIENPAVGGLRVGYTHSLASALLLKSGLLGLSLFLLYGFYMLKNAWPDLIEDKRYLFALAGPLLIGFLLYASYKSIGYGLLLLILASLAARTQKA